MSGGYSHPGYAASLSEFGNPRMLPRCGGWLLERPIPGSGARDAMGTYPIFSCEDWANVTSDVEELDESLVSLVLVTDPLADVYAGDLERAFPDLLVPFKDHLVRDFDEPLSLPAHHRRHLRRSSGAVEVEVCPDPVEHLDDWIRLYSGLVARHALVGIRAFSRESFRQQLRVAGMVALRAVRQGVTVGMTLWFEDAPHAYYHLGAYSAEGYEINASYALFSVALDHLRKRGVRWVDLGGAPGAGSGGDGLLRFKRGWANGDRVAHLCGRILDREAYERLTKAGSASTGWFPAYRATEKDLAGPVHRRGRVGPDS